MRVIVSGGWSYGNIGDEAIAKATQYELLRIWPNAEYIYLAFDPHEFFKHHQIESNKSVHRLIMDAHDNTLTINNLREKVQELQKTILLPYDELFRFQDTVFIMSGGGYFLESWEKQLISRLLELMIAKAHGAKTLVIGQSVGPFYSDATRRVVAKVLKDCDYVNVRDRSSYELLKTLDKGIRVQFSCDIANDIKACYPEKYTSHNAPSCQKTISMMLSAYSHHVTADSKKRYNKTFLKVFNRITLRKYIYEYKVKQIVKKIYNKKDYYIQFVMSTDWAWDHDFIYRMTKNLEENRFRIISSITIDQLCNAIRRSDYMISSKMHPLIISSSFGIPTIGISYNFKVDDFMASIKREKYCFLNRKINVDLLVDLLDTPQDMKQLEAISNEQSRKVKNMFDEIKNII